VRHSHSARVHFVKAEFCQGDLNNPSRQNPGTAQHPGATSGHHHVYLCVEKALRSSVPMNLKAQGRGSMTNTPSTELLMTQVHSLIQGCETWREREMHTQNTGK